MGKVLAEESAMKWELDKFFELLDEQMKEVILFNSI